MSFKVLFAPSWNEYQLLEGVARFAREHDWHINVDPGFDRKLPRGWQGDGVLSLMTTDLAMRHALTEMGLPWVDMSLAQSDVQVPRVVVDNEAIGRLAAEHFCERGFRHFAMYGGGSFWIHQERRDAFAAGLAAHGHALDSVIDRPASFPDSDWERKCEYLINEITALPKPLAVFAAHDRMAIELLEACLWAGIAVPDDVSVLGVDNVSYVCECLRIPLSSIDSNHQQLAYEAAAMLHAVMEGQPPQQCVQRVAPIGVVTRQSTDALGIAHEGVRKALHFVRNSQDLGISTKDIAKAAGMSQRGLENAFKHELGRLPGEELRRTRLRRAQQLLRETNKKISEIAQDCAYSSGSNLTIAFEREFDATPSAYRKQCQ